MKASLEAEIEAEYGIDWWQKLSAVHKPKHADAVVRCWMR